MLWRQIPAVKEIMGREQVVGRRVRETISPPSRRLHGGAFDSPSVQAPSTERCGYEPPRGDSGLIKAVLLKLLILGATPFILDWQMKVHVRTEAG